MDLACVKARSSAEDSHAATSPCTRGAFSAAARSIGLIERDFAGLERDFCLCAVYEDTTASTPSLTSAPNVAGDQAVAKDMRATVNANSSTIPVRNVVSDIAIVELSIAV